MSRGNRALWLAALAAAFALLPGALLGKAPGPLLLLQPEALKGGVLPAVISLAPGRLLVREHVLSHCAGAAMRSPDRRLHYDVDSQRCAAAATGSGWRPGTFDARAGKASDAHIADRLAALGYAVVMPPVRPLQAKYACSCPQNRSPDGVVVCPSQVADVSRSIAPIEFLAQDPDGDALTASFSHAEDGGAPLSGMAPGLRSDCTPAAGSLACEVSGRPLGASSVLTLSWSVSDGLATLPLQAMITRVPGPAGGLLFDGFEVAACP